MTLAEKLLPNLAEHRPTSPGRTSWTFSDPVSGWSVALSIDLAEALGCQLGELVMTRIAPAQWDGATLKSRATQLAARITGLMEPLRLIEVDGFRGEALLRSTSPTSRSEKRFHYELLLNAAGTVTLRRYQAPADLAAKREPISFSLTHEALGKFVDDVVAVLS